MVAVGGVGCRGVVVVVFRVEVGLMFVEQGTL